MRWWYMITPEGADTWASVLRSDVKVVMVDTVAETAWRRKGGGKERPGRKRIWEQEEGEVKRDPVLLSERVVFTLSFCDPGGWTHLHCQSHRTS